MNPEYKEITYHQLMKKIEVLNELNIDEGMQDMLGNLAKNYGKGVRTIKDTGNIMKTAYKNEQKPTSSTGTTPNDTTEPETDAPTSSTTPEKPGVLKKIWNTLKGSFRDGMETSYIGSHAANQFLGPDSTRTGGGRRGGRAECQRIKLQTNGLGKVKQNQILKDAGCPQIP